MDKEIIKLLSDMLDEKLDEKLEPIKAKLDEHSEILNSHSEILNSHSEILRSHSEVLNSHSEILNKHSIILDEHTQILRALEHSAQVNKAEQDKMNNDIAHMKGDVESIKKGLAGVEIITANNWSDIVRIKSLIQ